MKMWKHECHVVKLYMMHHLPCSHLHILNAELQWDNKQFARKVMKIITGWPAAHGLNSVGTFLDARLKWWGKTLRLVGNQNQEVKRQAGFYYRKHKTNSHELSVCFVRGRVRSLHSAFKFFPPVGLLFFYIIFV